MIKWSSTACTHAADKKKKSHKNSKCFSAILRRKMKTFHTGHDTIEHKMVWVGRDL